MKILVVEDEPGVASFIKKGLEENGYFTEIAFDGFSAEKLAISTGYDLYIIDIIIPGMSGFDLCRRLKIITPSIPVLILTALDSTDDKLLGFESGADDYLVKPFEFRELLARVKVLLKTSKTKPEKNIKLKVSDLEIDVVRKEVRRGKKEIDLTKREFALLEYMMKNKGKVLSRDEIAENVWGSEAEIGDNIVDVYVNLLRKKIDKNFDNKLIHTKIGFGYFLGEMI